MNLAGKRRPERAGRPYWVKVAEQVCPRLRSYKVEESAAAFPAPRMKIGHGIVFDRRLKFGLGATGHTQDIEYFGAVVPMTPSTFARLTPHRGDPPSYVRMAADHGKAFGTPILYLDFDPVSRTFVVKGHEGRGRMVVTRERAGDVPVPVAVMLRKTIYGRRAPSKQVADPKWAWKPQDVEYRAREWTADTVAALNYCVLPEIHASQPVEWGSERTVDFLTVRKQLAPVSCAFPEVYVRGKRYTVPECLR